MLRNSLLLTILTVILAFGLMGCTSPSEPVDLIYGGNTQPDDDPQEPLLVTGVNVGNEAPEFTLSDTYGAEVVLSELRDKPVLLYFWATGCQYCEDQHPRIQDFHATYGDSLTVLSINLGDDSQLINAYMAERDLTFPCLVATGAVQTAYEANSVPYALLLDAQGLVTFKNHPGYLTEAQLQSEF